jgi:hypothetical protein
MPGKKKPNANQPSKGNGSAGAAAEDDIDLALASLGVSAPSPAATSNPRKDVLSSDGTVIPSTPTKENLGYDTHKRYYKSVEVSIILY